MSKRIKPTGPALATRLDMEVCFGELALIEANGRKLAARLDKELADVKAKHQAGLDECAAAMKAKVALLEQWAVANRETEFANVKSLTTLFGTLGWRTSTPTLKPRSGFTLDDVLARLKAVEAWAGYVRTVEEVNREKIIADRKALSESGTLADMGVRIVQPERFFVEVKTEEDAATQPHS